MRKGKKKKNREPHLLLTTIANAQQENKTKNSRYEGKSESSHNR